MTRLRLKYLAYQAAFFVLSVVMISGAHAAPREHVNDFWREQMAQDTLYRPQVIQHTERAVQHVGRAVYRAGRVIVSTVYEGGSDVIRTAASYLGTNPTGWAHNWCAEFANRVLRQNGYATSGSAMALSFAHYGPHLRGPVPGAIAVLPGHVGFVESVRPDGSVVLVSGNTRACRGRGSCTGRSVYARGRFVAFVMPQRARSASNFVDQR